LPPSDTDPLGAVEADDPRVIFSGRNDCGPFSFSIRFASAASNRFEVPTKSATNGDCGFS
jgi:hypothetical protein